MNLVPIAKLAVHGVTTLSVNKVINDIIRNNVNVETTVDTVKIAAGSLVLASLVGEAATKHASERMNRAIAWFEKVKEEEEDPTT